jgi:hypothetical protein
VFGRLSREKTISKLFSQAVHLLRSSLSGVIHKNEDDIGEKYSKREDGNDSCTSYKGMQWSTQRTDVHTSREQRNGLDKASSE